MANKQKLQDEEKIVKTKIKFADISSRKEDKEARLLNKGHQKFTIDDITVTALNRKNAIKKIEKIKNINK